MSVTSLASLAPRLPRRKVVYPKRPQKPLFLNLVAQLDALGVPVRAELPPAFARTADVIVDAVFGFSSAGAPRRRSTRSSPRCATTRRAHRRGRRASGWDVERGDTRGDAPRPSALVSLTAPKARAPRAAAAAARGRRRRAPRRAVRASRTKLSPARSLSLPLPSTRLHPAPSRAADRRAAAALAGRHYLGGRFVPPSLARRYGFAVPAYRGSEQVVEIARRAARRRARRRDRRRHDRGQPRQGRAPPPRARALDPGAVDGAGAGVESVRSLYWWDGGVQDDAEWRVTHVTSSPFGAARDALARAHRARARPGGGGVVAPRARGGDAEAPRALSLSQVRRAHDRRAGAAPPATARAAARAASTCAATRAARAAATRRSRSRGGSSSAASSRARRRVVRRPRARARARSRALSGTKRGLRRLSSPPRPALARRSARRAASRSRRRAPPRGDRGRARRGRRAELAEGGELAGRPSPRTTRTSGGLTRSAPRREGGARRGEAGRR